MKYFIIDEIYNNFCQNNFSYLESLFFDFNMVKFEQSLNLKMTIVNETFFGFKRKEPRLRGQRKCRV